MPIRRPHFSLRILKLSFLSVHFTTTMETLLPHVKPQSLSSFPLILQGKKPSMSSLPSPQTHKISSSNNGFCMKQQQQPLPWPKAQLSMVTKCCKSSGGVISEVEDEMMLEEELLKQIGMGKLKDKCKESNGIAELLECLEREAIMGEDEGKEPTDYNRRAHIFDKSSRVFQALKEKENSSIDSGSD